MNLIFAAIILVLSLTAISSGQIVTLSGFLYDRNGAPVAGADLDFDNALTGRRMYTPGDNTDQSGFYRITIIAGTYHISYAPPPNSHLLGKQMFNFVLNESQIRYDTLESGLVISGIVQDSLGQPVVDVDFDVDSLGGGRVYTPNDASTLTGAYWLVAPPGDYRLRLSPPPGSRLRGLEIDTVSVAADTNIDFTLPPGWLLSGRVTDSNGAGLDSIQVDIRDFYSGQKIFVSNGETDTLGNYSIAVPGGTLTSRFTPPPGSRLVAVQNDSIFIDSDLTWNQLMRDGILVNCTVTDSSGVPISGVDFDFTDESTGIRAFTPFDQSNSGGRIIASLAPDTYTVRVDPPPGSLYDRLTITGLPLMNDTSLSFMLPEVQRILFSGRIVNRLGLGIPGIDINLRSSITGLGVPLSNNITDTLGSFETAVPIGLFDVSFSPPRGSRYVAFRIPGIQFSIDTVWSETVLDTGVIFSAQVFDLAGLPLANVDFDFIFETNGQEIYTPHDNTDNAGTVDVTVPAGIYTIELTPPGNSGFQAKILPGFNITGDTAITIVMTNAGQASPSDFMLKQNFPNPFNDRTSIAYTLLKGSEVKIYIYNAIGQRVIVIDKGYQEAGYYMVSWNGRDSNGGSVASGLYFYRLKTSSGSESKKMLFLK